LDRDERLLSTEPGAAGREVTPRLGARASSVLAIAGNAIPVLGVIFFGWDLFLVLALFWLENVVIGLFGILRVALAPGKVRRRLFEPLFFVVHYGGFMFAHAMLLLSVFGDTARVDGGVHEPVELLHYLWRPGVALATVALLLSHGWAFLSELAGGGRDALSAREAMTLPYRRVLITQAGLLLGAVLVDKLGQPVVGLVVLLAVKTLIDYRMQGRERRRAGSGD
jgi:hypothetical protein